MSPLLFEPFDRRRVCVDRLFELRHLLSSHRQLGFERRNVRWGSGLRRRRDGICAAAGSSSSSRLLFLPLGFFCVGDASRYGNLLLQLGDAVVLVLPRLSQPRAIHLRRSQRCRRLFSGSRF